MGTSYERLRSTSELASLNPKNQGQGIVLQPLRGGMLSRHGPLRPQC
jgi:hypothetical protein